MFCPSNTAAKMATAKGVTTAESYSNAFCSSTILLRVLILFPLHNAPKHMPARLSDFLSKRVSEQQWEGGREGNE